MRFFFVFALEYLLECINGLVRVFFVFVLEYLLECIYDWWGVTSFFFVFYAGLFCEAFHETHRFFHEEFRPRTCSIKFPCKNKNPALSQCKNKNTALSQCNGQKKTALSQCDGQKNKALSQCNGNQSWNTNVIQIYRSGSGRQKRRGPFWM